MLVYQRVIRFRPGVRGGPQWSAAGASSQQVGQRSSNPGCSWIGTARAWRRISSFHCLGGKELGGCALMVRYGEKAASWKSSGASSPQKSSNVIYNISVYQRDSSIAISHVHVHSIVPTCRLVLLQSWVESRKPKNSKRCQVGWPTPGSKWQHGLKWLKACFVLQE